MMRIGFHGGMCCGVKHILYLGQSPLFEHVAIAGSRDDEDDHPWDPTADGDTFDSNDNWFDLDAPKETGDKRLKRYLDFIAEYQPSCLVEVVIGVDECGYDQSSWIPVLEKHGFKAVTDFRNSNSGVELRAYHLVFHHGKVK